MAIIAPVDFGVPGGLLVQLCRPDSMQFKVVLFTSGSVAVVPPGVVQGELSTKGQAQFCDSFKRMVCWTCLGVT